MLSVKLFDISPGTQKVFTSDQAIKSKDYVAVYVSTVGLVGEYTVVNQDLYALVNDSIVFSVAPTGTFLRVVVGTNKSDLLSSPDTYAQILAIKPEISAIAKYLTELEGLYEAIQLGTVTGRSLVKLLDSDGDLTPYGIHAIDTTSGTILATLPWDTKVEGESFVVYDKENTFSTNNATVRIYTDAVAYTDYVLSGFNETTFVYLNGAWKKYDKGLA